MKFRLKKASDGSINRIIDVDTIDDLLLLSGLNGDSELIITFYDTKHELLLIPEILIYDDLIE